jgi:hypothetical protein
VIYILDASAMIAYLRAESGGLLVRDVLLDPAHVCFAQAINLCEVYYDFSPSFCQRVGVPKATQRRISLADCFGVTLTKTVHGTLLSADHHEFDSLAAAGQCTVASIR